MAAIPEEVIPNDSRPRLFANREPTRELFTVTEVFGLFVDAFVADELNQLVFVSLWGRDTAVQELLGRLTIPVAEGGLDVLTLCDGNGDTQQTLWVKDRAALAKANGRMPKDNLFGEMVQLWLFDPLVREPDRVRRRAYLLLQAPNEQRLWSLIKETCHLPLLDSWQPIVVSTFREANWLCTLDNVFGLCAIRVDLAAQAVEATLGDLIRAGRLRAA